VQADTLPDPEVVFPIPNHGGVTYVKPTITNSSIIVGDFTYFSDVDFEKHVTHFYPDVYGDRLVIGKFCQIASGVEFVMNGANHKMDCVSTFPFYIFEKWNEVAPRPSELSNKGDTIVGNDVWIGRDATILPGVTIGDGAIIGAKSVVGSDVGPYSIAVGNPARVVRKRFDDELVALLLKWKWWDLPVETIDALIPLLHSADLDSVKSKIKTMLHDKT